MVASLRRDSDDERDDHRIERSGGGLNGHTKWVVGVVSVGIVSALGWFAANDRQGFERRLQAVEAHVIAVDHLARQALATQQSQDLQSNARWEEVQRALARIESDVKEVKRKN